MLRRFIFAFAGIALAAFLAVDRTPQAAAADAEIAGNWHLTYFTQAGIERTFAIIKVEMKDGKPTASVVFHPFKGTNIEVTKTEVDGKNIKLSTSVGWVFEGTLGKDGKLAMGSIGPEQTAFRARLTRTEKTELAPNEQNRTEKRPDAVTEAQKLTGAVATLRFQAAREKDATKKKELLEKVDAAQKQADEKVPGLLREVVEKHADTTFAADAATDLLRSGAKYKLTADEAGKLLAIIEKQAAPYGTRYSNMQMLAAIEAAVSQKGLEGAVEAATAKLAKAKDAPAEFLSRVLSARKTALEALGKTEEAKAVAAELAKLEERIDAEYLKKVPPFKPTAFAGRKDKSANQVAVMELFTGAQCPPCVAADVAFDALQKAYKPSELILIQYHLHIPGPDPLTNADTVARARYYGANSTPSTFFNGKADARGGGGMSAAEAKYKQYVSIINPLLEKSTDVKVGGKASRTGDKLDIAVEVNGASGDDMKLRILVVEENVKYVGGNQLRFHHQVVRAMPTGAEGVAIKEKAFKHNATVDLAGVRKNLTKYLDDYAANTRPFPKPDRPMDMKAVKVIALVQNDDTKEIVQAMQIEVEGRGTGGQ